MKPKRLENREKKALQAAPRLPAPAARTPRAGPASELAGKGPLLQAGKQRIERGQGAAVAGFEGFDGGDAGGEGLF